MRSVASSCLAALMVASVTVVPANAQSVRWDMPNEYPATSPQGETDQFFSQRLSELSQGDIKITHHFGGALGFRSKDQLDAVADGAVPVANTFIAPLGGIEPMFLLMSLPFLTTSPEQARALFEVAAPYFDKVLERHNQKLLYSSPWAPSGLWSVTKVESMSDLAGMKLRSYDPSSTEVFRAAGAAPVQLSFADIVPLLSAGGISGVVTSIEVGLSASFDEYTPYFLELNYDSTINLATVNLDAWEELTDEQRAIVTQAARETEEYAWSRIGEAVREAYDLGKQRGMTIVTDIDPAFRAALVEKSEPVIQDWVAKVGADGQAILDTYRALSIN